MAATKPKKSASSTHSWRDIAQAGPRRSTTGYARRRRLLGVVRWMGILVVTLGAFGAAGYGLYAATQQPTSDEAHHVLSRITFRTDGVLDGRWFSRVASVRPGHDMAGLDLAAIKEKLESQGQVREATVTVRLPDELVVEVREQIPLLRARIALSNTDTRLVLIARDGTVYEGSNYSTDTLRALPFLGGVTFSKGANGGITPVRGIDTVAQLLDLARQTWPDIYGGWRVVDCQGFRGTDAVGSVITVNSRHVGEIVFAPRNFHEQVDRLAQIMSRAVRQGTPIQRIDLSFPGQAIVQYQSVASNSATHRR